MLELEKILFTAVLAAYFLAMCLYFAFIGAKQEKLSKAAVLVQAIGFVLHTGAIAARGMGAGRLPLSPGGDAAHAGGVFGEESVIC